MSGVKDSAVRKWGNSPAIRLPKKVMEKAGLRDGDTVNFEVKAPGVIVIRAATVSSTPKNLLARITCGNRHSEANWGAPQGHEVW